MKIILTLLLLSAACSAQTAAPFDPLGLSGTAVMSETASSVLTAYEIQVRLSDWHKQFWSTMKEERRDLLFHYVALLDFFRDDDEPEASGVKLTAAQKWSTLSDAERRYVLMMAWDEYNALGSAGKKVDLGGPTSKGPIVIPTPAALPTPSTTGS